MPTFGVLHDFRQKLPWTVPAPVYYEECLGLISEAEQLGYSAVWLSEHTAHLTGSYRRRWWLQPRSQCGPSGC